MYGWGKQGISNTNIVTTEESIFMYTVLIYDINYINALQSPYQRHSHTHTPGSRTVFDRKAGTSSRRWCWKWPWHQAGQSGHTSWQDRVETQARPDHRGNQQNSPYQAHWLISQAACTLERTASSCYIQSWQFIVFQYCAWNFGAYTNTPISVITELLYKSNLMLNIYH